MSIGLADLVEITDLKDLGTILQQVGPEQALVAGVNGHLSVQIVSERLLPKYPDAIARTKENFSYSSGPALILLDHDAPGAEMAGDSPTELLAILGALFPPIKNAAWLCVPSTSADIYDNSGCLVSDSRSYHLYFVAESGTDIPRFGAALYKRLWLSGYGHIQTSRAGTLLPRSLVDATVFSAERLDFCAPAILGKGLTQERKEPEYTPGGYVDTTLLKELSASEEAEYKKIVNAAKAKAAPEAAKIKQKYIRARVTEMAASGISEDEARETISRGLEKNELTPEFPLCFDDLGTCTVKDVLAYPATFNEATLADPLEPDAGRGKAKLFINKDGPSSLIRSATAAGCSSLCPAKAMRPPPVMPLSLMIWRKKLAGSRPFLYWNTAGSGGPPRKCWPCR